MPGNCIGKLPPCWLNFCCNFFTRAFLSTPLLAGISVFLFLLYYYISCRITLSAFLFGIKSTGWKLGPEFRGIYGYSIKVF